ncbi:ecotin [Trypanosoma conorhini]|uniref:Ecotin n=1 Tax=Trypanosoma conorhini TaxID=83891 RepID=A0A422Q6F8_9TRYP|nr:ecotin [Trypanosoma conorhini]RNF25565.1 ecotin [Trypanosoma conorhini]
MPSAHGASKRIGGEAEAKGCGNEKHLSRAPQMRDPKNYCQVTKKFPPPEEGERCCKFLLDPLDAAVEREHRMLELVPGRMQLVDGVNHNFLFGDVEEHGLEGHAYPYYRVSLGRTGRTRMAVPPGLEPRTEFVALGRRSLFEYNSKRPVVVYVPEDAKLRYRIWEGGEECVATEL